MSGNKKETVNNIPKLKRTGFELQVIDDNGTKAVFHMENSSHAENILRGLVHTGYKVSIQERIIEVDTSNALEIRKSENEYYAALNQRSEVGTREAAISNTRIEDMAISSAKISSGHMSAHAIRHTPDPDECNDAPVLVL